MQVEEPVIKQLIEAINELKTEIKSLKSELEETNRELRDIADSKRLKNQS